MKRALLLSVLIAVVAAHLGCRHRNVAPPTSSARPISAMDYLDLKPNTTVTVVVPILRSGGYVLPSVKRSTGTTDIQAGDDFVGYERAHYTVRPRTDGGIRIRFSHADVWKNGKQNRRRKSPMLPLFDTASNARYIRLVYLVRESKADHNMAIVAATDPQALAEVTQKITQYAECPSSNVATCTWVPDGVAVRPE